MLFPVYDPSHCNLYTSGNIYLSSHFFMHSFVNVQHSNPYKHTSTAVILENVNTFVMFKYLIMWNCLSTIGLFPQNVIIFILYMESSIVFSWIKLFTIWTYLTPFQVSSVWASHQASLFKQWCFWHIHGGLGSNLGQATNLDPPRKFRENTLTTLQPFPSLFFPIHYSVSSNHQTIWTALLTMSLSKNKHKTQQTSL
jgi:hypothetical protein